MQIGLGISPTVMAASGMVITAPAQPTGLTATPVSSSQIDLAWTDNAANEDNQKIYRSTDGINYSLIDTIAADLEAYNDTTVTGGTIYYYKVSAYNAGGETLSASSGATNTLLYGLVIALNLNETSGNRADDTGRGNTATQTGTVGYDTGLIGNAAKSANYTSGYLSVAYGSDVALGDTDWEKSIDIYLTDLTGWLTYSNQGNADGRDWVLWFDTTSGKFKFQESTTNHVVTSTVVFSATNVWAHVQFGYDKTNDKLFISVNGETLVQAAHAGGIADNSKPVQIGKSFLGGGAPANTRIDRYYHWNRLLSADERSADYAGGAPFALPF